MDVRLSIGDFSLMTHLSIKALRHYHDVGLLEPAAIDRSSGYRYYEPAQVSTALVIRRFRDLGMPLDEVKALLAAPDVPGRNEVIVAHLTRMQGQLEKTEATVSSLRSLIDAHPVPLEIDYRSVPPTPAIAVVETVKSEEALEWWFSAFDDLYATAARLGIEPSGPGGALFPGEFYEVEEAELVAFVPLADRAVEAKGRVERFVVPPAELAVALHVGAFQEIDRTYGALGVHVAERAIGVGGPIRGHYLVPPATRPLPTTTASRCAGRSSRRPSPRGTPRFGAELGRREATCSKAGPCPCPRRPGPFDVTVGIGVAGEETVADEVDEGGAAMTNPVPDRVARPDFGVSVRGYDRAQVDAYFGRVMGWLTEAENRTSVAERARESLAREVIDLRATITMLEQRAGLPAPESMSAFSDRMGQVMQSALEAAQELRAEAEEEAKERRESAVREAERVVTDAQEEAEKILSGARRAQRVMEESIADLRAARAEAVETLQDLQRRIAAVAGVPEPALDGEVAEDPEFEDETDVTTVVPAVGPPEPGTEKHRGPEAETDDDTAATAAVLVTADPTLVQPPAGRVAGDRRSARRRSA